MMPKYSRGDAPSHQFTTTVGTIAIPFRMWLSLLVVLLSLPFSALSASADETRSDDALQSATVDIIDPNTTLGDFLTLCETQTAYRFVYRKSDIQLDVAIVLTAGKGQTLSNLFASVSKQAGIVFERVGGQIAIRKLLPGSNTDSGGNEPNPTGADAQEKVLELDPFIVESEKIEEKQVLVEMRMQDIRFMNMLSNEDFSRLGLGDMSEAVSKVAGVTVADGRFAVIRGMSERYSATLVNGVPVPSPDPQKQGVHLDLFSSDIVDRLEVFKTFSPDAPGNASGGYINIVTTNIPYESFAKVSFGTKMNDRAQRDYVTYDNAGNNDSWAMGSKDRLVYDPDVKLNGPFGFVLSNYQWYTPEGFDMVPQHVSPSPGLSFEASFGTGNMTLWGHSIRAMGVVSYDSSYKTSDGTYQERGIGDPSLQISYTGTCSAWEGLMTTHGPEYDYTKSVASVDITALGAIQLDLDKKGAHKLTLNTFVSQSGTDTVTSLEDGTFTVENVYGIEEDTHTLIGFENSRSSGFFHNQADEQDWAEVLDRRYYWNMLYYEERNLSSVQLLGTHDFMELTDNPLTFNWVYSVNQTSTIEPDARSTEYYYDTTTGLYTTSWSVDDGGNNYRSWRNIDDEQHFFRGDVDFDWFINSALNWKISSGGFFDDDSRQVEQKYYLIGISGSTESDEDLYTQNGGVRFDIKASKRDVNTDASRTIKAGYLNNVLTLWDRFDLIAGFRAENLDFNTNSDYVVNSDNYKIANWSLSKADTMYHFGAAEDGTYVNGGLYRSYWLPNFGAAWRPLEGLAVRLNYSRTMSRPSFRETMAYFSFDPDGLVSSLGNPQLKPAEVRGTDLRVEYTWGHKGNLLAASVFYKEVANPIQKVSAYEPTALGYFETWVNIQDTAYLNGYELEWRTYLDFLGIDGLDNFSIGGNFSHIKAVVGVPKSLLGTASTLGYLNDEEYVTLPDDAKFPYYPEETRLYDQPEWIVNADLGYEIERSGTKLTLSYYAVSNVLDASGGIGYSAYSHDTYIDSYHRVDFILQQKLFTNCYLKFSVKNLTDSTRAIIYNPELTSQKYYKLKYRAGRDFSLSISYEF